MSIRRRRRQTASGLQAGFTIVETLIVLAVAGLILLIVFLAIPALQKSGRNNERRQDVQAILEAVSRYETNDSGKFPDDCGDTHVGQPPCSQPGGSTPNDHFLRFISAHLNYYADNGDTGNHIVAKENHAHAAIPTPDIDTIYIYNYEHCDANRVNATGQGAGYGDVVALYALEGGNGTTQQQCQQL